jgi:hypothetical protein
MADYEVRRELLRANKLKGIQRLNSVKTALGSIPITIEIMLRAAQLWAIARNQGQPTADDKALDARLRKTLRSLTAFFEFSLHNREEPQRT